MKNFLTAFLLFSILSIIGIWYYSCQIKGLCQEIIPYSVDSIPRVPNFSIKDENGGTLFQFTDKLKINNRNHQVEIPTALMSFRDSLDAYLSKNPNKELLIQGKYRNGEIIENTNKGVLRANYFKSLLVKYGIDSSKIETEGVREGFTYDQDGNYLGGVSLMLQTSLEEKETKIINRILYSTFGSKKFEIDSTILAYGMELKKYMIKYPTKTVQIIGHTDGIGSAQSNYVFGEERAKQVKTYLVSIGISEDRLIVISKGETEPIGDNKTPEGRAKNRRTAIIVN